MRKQYDIHRAARPLDQGIHEKYKGAVDFCGGAYGILKGAVKRERDMTEGGTASSAGAGVKEGGTASSAGAGVEEGNGKELRDIENREREARLVALQLDNMEREQALKAIIGGTGGSATDEHALKAKTGGAHQSQVRLRIALRRGLQRVCL